MKNYYIFKFEDSSSGKLQVITVLFMHQSKVEQISYLSEEINQFFQNNSLSDKIVVLLPGYMDSKSKGYFVDPNNIEEVFERLPGRTKKYFEDNLSVFEFNDDGNISLLSGKHPSKSRRKFIDALLRSGTVKIFQTNGGIVESSPDHHFVFPSGKHSSKFLRTGNVLIKNAEIFFIAVQLLAFIKNIKTVYCDTSSINVLPFATMELMRRFNIRFESPTIHSFESYEVFERNKNSFDPESLVLISSSTSGNIIDRLIKEKLAIRDQIKVIYYLGPEKNYLIHESNIVCNLTKDEQLPEGEIEFNTYPLGVDCDLCEDNSRPIEIRSDVFMTIQPKVEKVLINANDDCVPKYLSRFIEDYKFNQIGGAVLKCYYKEDTPNSDYEVYIDTNKLFDSLDNGGFPYFNNGLTKLINKHIPANVKYVIHLSDKGSALLAQIVKERIPKSISPETIEIKPGFADLITETGGSAVVVASCITTGKKLLHISRLMRKHENISLIYFIGILRPPNADYLKRLQSNLSKGRSHIDERPVVSVEKIVCSNAQSGTSFFKEKTFLEDLIADIDETAQDELYNYINDRITTLLNNKKTIGLSDEVFLRKYNGQKLELQKNFAFWKFTYETAVQSEVYFTISSIITNLENKPINIKNSLQQSNYVRNLLDPANFNRFNDGIIQAALLRVSKAEYLSYDLDSSASLEMRTLLVSMIEQYNTEHGEALMEFLLALGLKKLKLRKDDLSIVLNKSISCNSKVISEFSEYIKGHIVISP